MGRRVAQFSGKEVTQQSGDGSGKKRCEIADLGQFRPLNMPRGARRTRQLAGQ